MKMMRGALVLTAWGSLAFANPLQVQQKQPNLVQRLEKQCQANDAGACHLAATRYRLGQGVPRDPSRGEKLLMKALDLDEAGCRRGDAVSCFVAPEIHRPPPLPDER